MNIIKEYLKWYIEPFKKYAKFSGRSRRKEFWTFWFVNNILMIIGYYIDEEYLVPLSTTVILLLILIVPSIAVAVRRLHDIGKSGFWYFIVFIPIIGSLYLFYLEALDSQPATNKYGPNPKIS